ncbi:anti-sigma regulatory factor [bacterium]|nr:anti-sigma regulatory factor [bacterium]
MHDGQVNINGESDIVSVRKTIREAARSIGFGLTDVTRIVTAVSELARNVSLYAGTGVMRWRRIAANPKNKGIEIVFEDHGPGISNIGEAMQQGFTTSGGLGMGLPGAERLMGEMEVQSEPGKGTTVIIRKWFREM